MIEALAKKPVIYKIDLTNNKLSNESIKVIRKLLKGQIKLAKDFPLDKRLYASFLAEITLDSNPSINDHKLMEKMGDLLKILKFCNAQAHIRSVYINSSAPVSRSRIFFILSLSLLLMNDLCLGRNIFPFYYENVVEYYR